MFTGIIEEIGTIATIQKGSRFAVLSIVCNKVLEQTKIGDSIAVNGVCLTVTSLHEHGYTADVMPETLERSCLGRLKKGSRVNLERAMALGERFGGHIVAGHIDGVGTVQKVESDDNVIWYTIQAEPDILRYIVEKGSIAVDGISLTVARVTKQNFSVSLIPYTKGETTLCDRKVGDSVNLECDMLAKYVEKLCGKREESNTGNLSKSFLMEHGYLQKSTIVE